MFGLVIQKTKLCSSKMQPLQSLFSLLFPVSRPHYLCGLLCLTGAWKDLLWYLVFVERDQQARTSSLRSSPDSPTSFHEQLSCSLSPAPPSPYSASANGTPSALMHTRCQIWQRSKKAQIAPACVQADTVHSHTVDVTAAGRAVQTQPLLTALQVKVSMWRFVVICHLEGHFWCV